MRCPMRDASMWPTLVVNTHEELLAIVTDTDSQNRGEARFTFRLTHCTVGLPSVVALSHRPHRSGCPCRSAGAAGGAEVKTLAAARVYVGVMFEAAAQRCPSAACAACSRCRPPLSSRRWGGRRRAAATRPAPIRSELAGGRWRRRAGG